MKEARIGIFDSGVGGLTVARAILDILPNEKLYYIGDTAHTPYGEKSLSEVREYALEIMDHLAESGVKMIVIACNTASCAVYEQAQARYERLGIPVVEVINPAVEKALGRTRNKKVGVIGTTATVESHIYQNKLASGGVLPFAQACPKFVPFAEAGITHGQEVLKTADTYLSPLIAAEVDTLVLGCTHYPLLSAPIRYLMGNQVQLVSSSEACAQAVYNCLIENDLLRDNYKQINQPIGEQKLPNSPEQLCLEHCFTCTRESEDFSRLAGRIMGHHFQGIAELKELQ